MKEAIRCDIKEILTYVKKRRKGNGYKKVSISFFFKYVCFKECFQIEILEKITKGKGTLQDLADLEDLSEAVKANSLCGLGQTAANPVLSTMRQFKDEYIAHVVDKQCPAHICKDLMQYVIVPETCKGCSKCSRVCPVGAISGVIKQPFVIDQNKCIKCGMCISSCPFHAIIKK